MPASYVQNHVQQFEGRVRRGPLNAGLRSSPSRIQDSIRELPDGNVSAGRRDAGGSGGVLSGFNITHLLRTTTRGGRVSYKASVVARVRNGFVPASRRQVFTKLKPLLISKCPFVNLPETHKGRWGEGLTAADMDKCVWVRPEIVTRIEFLEWTESEKTVSDYTRSSSTVREVSDHASHPSPLWP